MSAVDEAQSKRNARGTISIDASPSYEEMVAPSHSNDTQETSPPPPRQRLYSEEDEDLRKAKAMALAIQQHPNMTPEEIHQMHIGDEQQSQLVESIQKRTKPDSSFLGSIRESQKKTKELFQTMIVGTATPTNRSMHGTSTRSMSASSTSTPLQQTSSTPTSSVSISGPSQEMVDTAPVISPAAVARRAAEAAVQDKIASPVITTDNPLASNKKKTHPMAAAKTRANSGVAAAKATADTVRQRANSAASKAKGAMKKKPSETSPSSTPPDLMESKSSEQPMTNSVIRLKANVWKRRGGMGKLSYSKAWERRKVILQGSKLFYFKMNDSQEEDALESKDATWFEQAAATLDRAKGAWLPAENDPSIPRGYFDLLKEGATVAASSGHSGAPSPFAISIKVRSDTVWKLCFDEHATQMEWLAALTDVVVNASVDAYNANLLLAADPNHEATMFESEYLPPPGVKEAGQRLWMAGTYRISSMGLDEEVREVVVVETETPVSSSSGAVNEGDDVDRWILHETDLHALFCIVNVALVLCQSSSVTPQQFWYILTFCNMGIGYYLVKGYKKRDTSSAPALVSASKLIKDIVLAEEPAVIEEEEVPTFKPVAGTTTVKLENPSDSPELDGQVFGAWCAPPGQNILVRSHGYLDSRTKIPSPGELYECTNVDIFESPHRYPDMGRRVTLPKVKFEGQDPVVKTWYAPDVFIVSVALPTDPPKMRSCNDGGGFTITIYFTMKQETRDILRRVTSESYDPLQEPMPDDIQKSKVNAVKLFNEYCRRAPTDPSFQGRFKVIADCQNIKEIGLPTWIAKYNATPVLIKRAGVTGFLYPHPELSCIEFDVSFHPFPYLAKQAVAYMKDNYFKKVLVTFGFVIEGRSDDELPECVLGLMQLCYPNPIYAIQAADFFAGTSPKSF